MWGNVFLWLRTVRYLRPIQIIGRLWFKGYRPRPDLSPAPELRNLTGQWREPVPKQQSMLKSRRFRFLNVEHEVVGSADWNNPVYDTLWLYNLHYFDDLNATGAPSRLQLHQELLLCWVSENPPAGGVGWAPYPTSLRIVNWIKWSLAGNTLLDECLHSLAVQARWLRRQLEYHLLGNHLFANAKALVFAGLFFEGDEADRWLQKGMAILEKEIPEQILADGGHFERSPMYHLIVLEDLLDLVNLHQVSERPCPSSWRETIARMLNWARLMRHPDGEISFFNDAAFRIAPLLAEIDAYAERLSVQRDELSSLGTQHLEQSGYARMANHNAVLLMDIAPVGPDYLPGHAHADTLSFELSLFGLRVFVNSGTSTYEQGELRHWQRSTAAHNTVVIDGENSSEVWAGFRMGRRARPSVRAIDGDDEALSITANHDGYRRLPGKNIHERRWQFHPDSILIEDRISGPFENAFARFYLHPDVKVEIIPAASSVRLELPQGQQAEITVEQGRLQVEESHWYPEFGISVPNQCLVVSFTQAVVRLRIQPVSSVNE